MKPTRNAKAILSMRALATREANPSAQALLRILALGERQVAEGKTVAADAVFRRLRERA